MGSGLYIQSATSGGVVLSGFEWDDGNIFHIAEHEFTPDELDGRLAFVVFRRLPGGGIRVIAARDMDDGERRLFRRK